MDGKKLIYAEDFISTLRDDPFINGVNFKRVVQHINDAPAVDAVVHGEWEKQQGIYSCSICGKACPYDVQADIIQYWTCNYCPNCGAKMDGGNEDG